MNTVLSAAICAATVVSLMPTRLIASPTKADTAIAYELAGASVLMGIATAGSAQTIEQRTSDRALLRKRLGWLMANRMREPHSMQNDYQARIVRVLFDVDTAGHAMNVRVGKRSGNRDVDLAASAAIAKFDGLPGGERRRVCALIQYANPADNPNDPALVNALKSEEQSAIADLKRGIEGPTYDAHGKPVYAALTVHSREPS